LQIKDDKSGVRKCTVDGVEKNRMLGFRKFKRKEFDKLINRTKRYVK